MSGRFPTTTLVLALLAALLALAGCGHHGGTSSSTDVNMISPRYGHTATALPDGRVVLVGGVERSDFGLDDELVSRLEIFDPVTERFTTGRESLDLRRAFHAASFSNGGTPADPSDDYILVSGGLDVDADRLDLLSRATLRIATIDFSIDDVEDLPTPTMDHQAVTLPDGRVAFIFGRDESGDAIDDIVIYAADGRTIDTTDDVIGEERWNHRAVSIPDGSAGAILVTGGRDETDVEDDGFLYDVATGTVSKFGLSPGRHRQLHTLTYLDAGTPSDLSDDVVVETGGLKETEEDLFCGCLGDDGDADTVQLYRVQSGAVAPILTGARLRQGVFFHAAAVAASGTAAIVSGGFRSIFFDEHGHFTGDFIDSDPGHGVAVLTWNPATSTLAVRHERLIRARAMHAAAPLPDGRVLVTGGINDDRNSVRGAERLAP